VYDLVKFARAQNILCQGRGSAANSAVCYALGITEVDPARMSMLFERFVSRGARLWASVIPPVGKRAEYIRMR